MKLWQLLNEALSSVFMIPCPVVHLRLNSLALLSHSGSPPHLGYGHTVVQRNCVVNKDAAIVLYRYDGGDTIYMHTVDFRPPWSDERTDG